MSQFATLMLMELGRTTLWLALAGVSAALLLKWARIQSPTLHRACWCVTLLVGCFFVRLPLEVPWYAAEPIVAPAPQYELPTAEIFADDPELATMPPSEAVMAPLELDAPIEAAPAMLPATTPVSAPPARWMPSLAQLAIVVWLAGIVALVTTWLAGYCWFVWRLPGGLEAEAGWQAQWNALLAGQGASRPIPLRVTGNLGPLLCRLPRGYELLVPEPLWRKLNPAEREAILRHEWAHYRRGDVWKSLAVRVLAMVHWFNPVSWWAVRRFDEAAEWACDRAATDGEPTAYAKILVRLSEIAGPRARYGSALRGRPLAARIRRLVIPEPKEDSAMKKALLITAAACVVAAALVRVQLVAQEPAEPRDAKSAKPSDSVDLPLPAGDPSPADIPVVGSEAEPTVGRNIVEAAKEAYKAAVAAHQAETTTLEPVYLWSSRWRGAELSAARNQKERIAAATAHLERMRKLQKRIKALSNIGTHGGEALEMASANFYVAEAERKLAELESRPTLPQTSLPPRNDNAPINRYSLPAAPVAPVESAPRATPRQAVPPVPIPNTVPAPIRPSLAPRAVAPPAPAQQPASPYATPPATAPPTVSPYLSAPAGGAAKGGLRYDGKTFDQWVALLRTDLSPIVRTEALIALAEFAVNGYGRQTAEIVFDYMRNYSVWTLEFSQESNMKQAAIRAVRRAPLEDVLPFITERLKSGNSNQRLFALRVLPVDKAKDEIVPLLVSAMQDQDPQVADMARPLLALVDHDNPALADWLRAALSGTDRHDLEAASALLARSEVFVSGMPTPLHFAPFPELAPELIALLGHGESAIRHQAANALRQLGPAAIPALERESSKSATDTTSNRARQILPQILKPSPGPVKAFDWEHE